jgi:hypothetical protein
MTFLAMPSGIWIKITSPEMGDTNPFLHMSMHVAIKEQLSINQPIGICERFARLQKKYGSEHVAAHQTYGMSGRNDMASATQSIRAGCQHLLRLFGQAAKFGQLK